MSPDPFGLAALREATVAAWRATPARLREDANTEEDYARGYYRDRVVAELTQNAADAAIAAGVPGRLLLRLTDTELIAANTGAPLDAAGVAAMARMRASAKTYAGLPTTVGHFGVGFAAVRSVSDHIEVHSVTGSVLFSLDRLRAELAGESAELAEVVARREGDLPALRLPYPIQAAVPAGYSTEVVLRLRGEREVAAVRAQLADLDRLALAFPALAEIQVADGGGPRFAGDLEQRYLIVRRSGRVPEELTADRAVEERGRLAWSLTCAVPKDPPLPRDRYLGAPTPTQDPLSIPAMVIGSFPLDPTRRHLAAGPITDFLLDQAGSAYAELVRRAVGAGGGERYWRLSDLVPAGLPAGEVDARLRAAIDAALANTPVFASGTGWVSPAGALLASPQLSSELGADVAALADALGAGGVIDPGPAERALAERLGAAAWQVSASVDVLPDRALADYARLYRRLAPLVGPGSLLAEDLARLPVPLRGGGVYRGPRAVTILADADADAGLGPGLAAGAGSGRGYLAELAQFGLHLAHPGVCDEQSRRLLTMLGAEHISARGLLSSQVVRAAIEAAIEEDAPERAIAIRDAVLSVVALAVESADLSPAQALGLQPDLAQLPLTDDLIAAEDLVLPDSVLSRVVEQGELDPVSPDLIERWGRRTLAAVGVRDRPLLLEIADPFEHNSLTEALADWPEFARELADAGGSDSQFAVADLDLVRDEAWPELLAELLNDPRGRQALGRAGAGPSYTRWWMARYGPQWLSGRSAFALPGAPESISQALVRRLVPAMPPQLARWGQDPLALRALGGVDTIEELTDEQWTNASEHVAEVFDAEPGPDRPALAIAWWQSLARAARAQRELDLPWLPALTATGLAVVALDRVVVADTAMHLQCVGAVPMVVSLGGQAIELASTIDAPLASEILGAELRSSGRQLAVPVELRRTLAQMPATWIHDPQLSVDDLPVNWWVEGNGPGAMVWARGEQWLPAALAHACGLWHMRRALIDGHPMVGPQEFGDLINEMPIRQQATS